jgi:hypothetical protein
MAGMSLQTLRDNSMDESRDSTPDSLDNANQIDAETSTPVPTVENTQDPRSSPDPLAMPATPRNPSNKTTTLQKTVPQKRPNFGEMPAPRTPNPPTGAFFSSVSAAPIITTTKMGIQVARDALINAATFAPTNREQTNILDLIEILRDYTESGRVRKEGTAIVTTQISQLNAVSKTLTRAINAQQKSAPKDLPSAQPFFFFFFFIHYVYAV